MPRKVVIIQARMGSSRLPGKVLMDLGGKSIVEHVLNRASAIPGVAEVCLATSIDPLNDPLAVKVAALGYRVVRGSEQDVLGRFIMAATETEAETILRITADCPLIDPVVCGDVLALLEMEGTHYASNVERPEWPHGLDCEAFTREILVRADQSTRAPDEREHVTLWIRRHKDLQRSHLPGPGGAFAEQRWVVDTPEDLNMLRTLFKHLRMVEPMPGWQSVYQVCKANPDLKEINETETAVENRYQSAIQGNSS